MSVHESEVQLGRSKVFLRKNVHIIFENHRVFYQNTVILIQSWIPHDVVSREVIVGSEMWSFGKYLFPWIYFLSIHHDKMFLRNGTRVKVKSDTRCQLATIIQPEWARLGVNGHVMSNAEVEEHSAHLKMCRELFNKLEDANITDQKVILERVNALFKKLGCESNKVGCKMEAFLCILYSGLLFICVNKVLLAIENWDLC